MKGAITVKKKHVMIQLLYYALVIIIYMAFLYTASFMLNLFKQIDNIVTVILLCNAVLYLMTPILIAVLMRFSLFRWYVDPIAAAETPLFLYASMIISQMRRTHDFVSAFNLVNGNLKDDGGMGWLFLAGLFLFTLLMSFSVARKKGESISYRLISKLGKASDGTDNTNNHPNGVKV